MTNENKCYPCPCCGYLTVSENTHGTFEICPVCNWEDDNVQFDHPDYQGGANEESLNEARQNYKKFGAALKRFVKAVRAPLFNEYQPEADLFLNRVYFGKALLEELKKGQNFNRISGWPSCLAHAYMKQVDRELTSPDKELLDLLNSISCMTERQFKTSYNELEKLAHKLIAEEDTGKPLSHIPEAKNFIMKAQERLAAFITSVRTRFSKGMDEKKLF